MQLQRTLSHDLRSSFHPKGYLQTLTKLQTHLLVLKSEVLQYRRLTEMMVEAKYIFMLHVYIYKILQNLFLAKLLYVNLDLYQVAVFRNSEFVKNIFVRFL